MSVSMSANDPMKMPRKQTLSMNEIFVSFRRYTRNRHANNRARDAIKTRLIFKYLTTFLIILH
jgi:hypothetical protein